MRLIADALHTIPWKHLQLAIVLSQNLDIIFWQKKKKKLMETQLMMVFENNEAFWMTGDFFSRS